MPVLVNRSQLPNLPWISENLDAGDQYHYWSFSDGEHGVRASIVKVPKGYEYRMHKHLDWAHVTLVEGRIRLETADGDVHLVDAGGSYFVTPGEAHIETMLADSVVVVLTGPDERYTRRLHRAHPNRDQPAR